MSHTCSILDSEHDGKCSGLCRCGTCGETFSNICSLHNHLTAHGTSGSYYYDDITKVAFPKYDTACSSTQTDETHTNYLHQFEFAERVLQLLYVKQEVMAETNETEVEVKDTPYIGNLDSDKGRNSVRPKEQMENESFDFMSVVDKKYPVKKCSVKIQKLTDQDIMSLVGKQSTLESIIKLINKETNSSFVQKAPCSKETQSEDLSNTSLLEMNEKLANNPSIIVENNENKEGGTNNYEAEILKAETVCNDRDKEKNELSLKIQDTVQLDMKNGEVTSLPKFERDTKVGRDKAEKRKLKKNQKEYWKKIYNVEKNGRQQIKEEISYQNLSGLPTNDKYGIDFDENIDSGGNESEREYFYGKNNFGGFVFERIRPNGIFNKGEKDEDNRVLTDGTWLPLGDNMSAGTRLPVLAGVIMSDDKLESNEKDFSESLFKTDAKDDLKESSQSGEKHLRERLNHTLKSQLICNQCGKSFKHRHNFEGHMNLHAGLKPYICQYCGKTYPSKSTLRTHENNTHSDRSQWLKCSICNNKQFPTLAKLKIHETTHATGNAYICSICNKSYKSNDYLKAHVDYCHNSKKFRCRDCKKSFDSVEERTMHQKVKHGSEIRCSTCGRQFTSIKSKHRHEKIHLGIKPHECHICPRRFLQKTLFWVHMEKHHDLTKADLIRLFPEKHLNINQQHLIDEIKFMGQSDKDTDEVDNPEDTNNELIIDTSEDGDKEILPLVDINNYDQPPNTSEF